MKALILALVAMMTLTGCSSGKSDAHNLVPRQDGPDQVRGANTPATDDGNRRTARAEADRTIGLIVPPPGAKLIASTQVQAGSRSAAARQVGREVRTRVYTLDAYRDAVRSYFAVHPPAGLRRTGFDNGPEYDGSYRLEYVPPRSVTPAADIAGPVVTVSWRTAGERTTITYTVEVDARHAVPAASRVVPPVSSIVVVRDPRRDAALSDRGAYMRRVITDPAAIDRWVTRANALAGSLISPYLGLCPMVPVVQQSVTFHDAAGLLRYTWTPGCFAQIQVARQGVRVGPTLDPGGRGGLEDLYYRATRDR